MKTSLQQVGQSVKTTLFSKSLQDVVKGIRGSKGNEDQFIRTCISEIRQEALSTHMEAKVKAVQKLTYLNMIGYDMSWAQFHVIEVMSDNNYANKRVGYLAASQCFSEESEILVMTTQLIKKDLANSNPYVKGLALTCLSTIASPDLSRDLLSDIVALLNSTRKYVRKKAVLVLFKVFIQYPDALRPVYPRLKEKLKDSDPSVVSSAVNIVCELARKNPKNYLRIAPIFFKLLTTLKNTWTTIKIIKLFGALAPHEPRLAKKLVDPIRQIIETTTAKSLLYECLFTVTKGMLAHKSIVRLTVEKLKEFVQSPDQNLKYLGLLGLNNVLVKYPRIISDMKDMILECLEDEDITIRYRALDLLCGVVNKKNIKVIIHKLIKRYTSAEEDSFRNKLIEKIIETCSKNNYANIGNFKWYISILLKLTEMQGIERGDIISFQLTNIAVRVKTSRAYSVDQMIKLIKAPHVQNANYDSESLSQILNASAWIIGEYFKDGKVTHEEALQSLMDPILTSFPSTVQYSFVQACIKIYSDLIGKLSVELKVPEKIKVDEKLIKIRKMILEGFEKFRASSDVEVQERVANYLKIILLHESLLESGVDIGDQILSIYEEEMNPVAPSAQEKVPLPEGLDLDKWINSEKLFEDSDDSDKEDDQKDDDEELIVSKEEVKKTKKKKQKKYTAGQEVFILGSDKKDKKEKKESSNLNDPNIPQKDITEILGGDGTKKKKTKGKKKKTKKEKEVEEEEENVEILGGEEMPENSNPVTDVENKKLTEKEKRELKLKEIDLKDITEKEKIYEVKEYGKQKPEDFKKDKKSDEKKSSGKKKKSKKSSEEDKEVRKTRRKSIKKKGKKLLAKDQNIRVLFDNKTKPSSEKKLSLPIFIENVGENEIEKIYYNLSTTVGITLEGKKKTKCDFDLKPKAIDTFNLNLEFQSVLRPLRLPGKIEYLIKGKKEKETLKFKISLPCSTFIQPKDIALEELIKLVKNNVLPQMLSRTCKLNDVISNVEAASKIISKKLSLSVVGNVKNKAFHMYGLSAQNHHIVALVKGKDGSNTVTIELRTPEDLLSNNLLGEVEKLFKSVVK